MFEVRNDFDVWIDTGDFFNNVTRGNRTVEPPAQRFWFRQKGVGDRLVVQLAGRQVILVQGNHDYTSLRDLLVEAGHPEGRVFEISVGNRFEYGGFRFAGFREVNWIVGEWNGERHDLFHEIAITFEQDPTVLITHTPPAGILDSSYGSTQLATRLFYDEHRVKHHLFGHIHEFGGEDVRQGDIHFYNGARTARILTIE